eukprot:CAMPEP_0202691006 /NCGR_PEP_ID=MMETSP1385-20130828/5846_1 /ASSEMBLY_ACC=CAM_ASM_000861 /TAXON_ID=933848 /ORGANISM="Elphidium margaritaceum" /LENGTH=236 /DNA_ID=CAMNT_0049346347 /DNA_START=23 /DNA_END=733 /DNA_ORIENTATION=+
MACNSCNEFRNFTKVISNLNGRDKVNKTVQFGSKIVFYFLTQIGSSPDAAKRFTALSAGIGNARKVDRLLKSSVEAQSALDVYNNTKMDEFSRSLKLAGAVCMALYWWCDNKVFLGKLKVLQNIDISNENVRAHKFWLAALLISVYFLQQSMSKTYQKRKELTYDGQSDEESISNVERQLHLQRVQFFGLICDVIVGLNNAGFIEKVKGSKLNDAQFGAVGLCSALSVLYRIWPSN